MEESVKVEAWDIHVNIKADWNGTSGSSQVPPNHRLPPLWWDSLDFFFILLQPLSDIRDFKKKEMIWLKKTVDQLTQQILEMSLETSKCRY